MAKGARGNITIDGGKELSNLLAELPKRVKGKAARQAVTAGSTPILRTYRSKVAKRTGLLKRASGRKVKTYKGGERAAAVVGARTGIQAVVTDERGTRRQVPANYSHLVELGTKPHWQPKRKAFHPGSKARPALKPAYDANLPQAKEIIGKKFAEVIDAECRKLART